MPDAPSSPLAVSARSLTKTFRSGDNVVRALDHLDFDMAPGEFTAVMGASGSGKSTFLHLLAGLICADEGELRIGGECPEKMSDKELTHFRRDHIGLVFQAFNLLPTLTVEENITLPLLAGNPRTLTPEEMTDLLKSVGLDHRRTHRPAALSGGEQQRVAIARALVTNPTLLLADEPTGNLDSLNSKRICDILTDLHKTQKRTILLVTHEPLVALRAERIIILKDGRLISDEPASRFSSAAELAEHYQSLVD